MWSSGKSIAFLSLAVLFGACNKEAGPWDKEADLTTDTSVYLNALTYVSHTDSEILVDLEMVQFNNLECESNYTNVPIVQLPDSYLNLEIVSETAEVRSPVASFSSLFLFEQSGNDLNFYGETSFYLKRFFELSENMQPQRQIAMATYLAAESNTIQFHKENGNLYENSAAYNDSILIDLIHRSEQYPGSHDGSGEGLMNVLFSAIDELVSNPATVGDRSITIFEDYENNNAYGLSDLYIDSIIGRALMNNVKLNVVYLQGDQLSRMALETGGFLIDDRDNSQIQYEEGDYERTLSSIGNNIANLDRILSQDLTVHKFRVRGTPNGTFTFTSGFGLAIELNYNNNAFRLYFKIP